MDALWHGVPRLDTPDKLWLLPAPVAKWLGAGVSSGPVLAQWFVFFGGQTPEGVWSLPVVWLVWLAGMLVGALGAFWRPGGLNVAQWPAVLVDWTLVPRKTVWGGRVWTG
jgi:hypothetical protein